MKTKNKKTKSDWEKPQEDKGGRPGRGEGRVILGNSLKTGRLLWFPQSFTGTQGSGPINSSFP